MTEYKGFKIYRADGYSSAYHIYKGKDLFSSLMLSSIDVAKRCIDTYFKRCGGEEIPLIEQEFKEVKTVPQNIFPIIENTREIHLSEHEKYIQKLLSEK